MREWEGWRVEGLRRHLSTRFLRRVLGGGCGLRCVEDGVVANELAWGFIMLGWYGFVGELRLVG